MNIKEKQDKPADTTERGTDKKNQVTRINKEGDGQLDRNREHPLLRPYYETETLDSGNYKLRVWMPGVSKRDVSVSLDNDVLTIDGQRGSAYADDWKPLFTELPVGDYRLRLSLNIKVDEERISATVEEGILTLDLPISEIAKPRKIEIK